MSSRSSTIADDAPPRSSDECGPGAAPADARRSASRSRPLSPLAVTMLCLSTLANGNGCKIVELGGRLDHDRLRRAIAAALRRHPLLNSRLRWRWPRWVWDEARDGTLPLDLLVQRLPTDDRSQVQERLVHNLWGTSLPAGGGRPVRFFLLETTTGSYLQIVGAHVCTDARAIHTLAGDISAAYAALEQGRPLDEAVRDVPDRGPRALFTGDLPWRTRARYLLAAARLMAEDLLQRDIGLALDPPAAAGVTRVAVIETAPGLLDRVREEADRRNVSPHAMFCLALLRAREDFNRARGCPGRVMRVHVAFSLRPLARCRVDDLCDVMVVPYRHRLDPAWSDDEVLRRLSLDLQHLMRGGILTELYRQRLYGLLVPIVPTRWATRGVTRAVAKSNVVIANPGRVPPFDHFGSAPVRDYYGFAPLFPPARLQLEFDVFRRRLRIIAQYDGHAFPRGVDEAFVGPLLAHLDRLCRPQRMAVAAQAGAS